MKITKCSFYKYRIRLRKPIIIASKRFDFREGIILVLEDKNGERGLGDIAPLYGFSRESLDDVILLLPKIRNSMVGRSFEKGKITLEADFPPSVEFALEAALLTLFAKGEQQILSRFLNRKAVERIAVNALLTRSELGDMKKIIHLKNSAYKSIKIKVSPQTMERDVNNILKINEIFAGDISFRFDGNRSFSLTDALRFTEKIKVVNLDYFEEPLNDLSLLRQFYERSACPYAVDESIPQIINRGDMSWIGLKALIIKPQLIGSLMKITNLIKKIDNGKPLVVISDVFSSGIGVALLVQYAAAVGNEETAMGLDTYSYLEDDILTERLPFEGGGIHAADSWRVGQFLEYSKMIKLDF